ncbi:MAG: co-chaperone GroES family protein [candidate division KSB1 bacterium]|nr:co-chaperone GroES family protein [candidate division KSB1 bacterium]
MKRGNKELIVVGDRLLIIPDAGEDRSNAGLYLPKWAVEKESIQTGRIVELGTGTPMANPHDIEDEPWKQDASLSKDLIQAQIGDLAIFLRKAAVEIDIDSDKYLIVPHAAVLLLIRPAAMDS